MVTDFTEASQPVHPTATLESEGPFAMKEKTKENMVIPLKLEQLKLWARWVIEATTWLVCFGLLAASAGVGTAATLSWLVSGSEVILVLGLGGGLMLGLAGIWHLLRQLERVAGQLRNETPAVP